MPRAMRRAPVIGCSAHQHLPCSPSTAAMPASTAGTGGESATCTCHAAMRWKTTYTCQYPRAQRRCAASLGALSAQYSNLAAADSKHSAQCGASVKSTSDASLRDGSGSQRTLMRTCACAGALLARACECDGCASVSPMWTLRVPHAGHHVVDRTPGWDPTPGWDISGGTLGAQNTGRV
jgi:hypothetical protein